MKQRAQPLGDALHLSLVLGVATRRQYDMLP
jgi:hypothetical protein